MPKKTLEGALFHVVNYYQIDFSELTIHFVSKRKICELHEEYFNDPTPTDCITFALDPPPKKGDHSRNEPLHLGDIFVCPEVAFEYSKARNLPYLEELCRYMIHGLLHLLGHNDISNKERREMRRKERFHLNRLLNKGLLS